jgi:prepilin-type N-terminal cleavage/methylation domain-containing protein
MDRESGFTLVELIIVVAMVAVISAFALPNFLDWLPNYRLRAAAHDLFSNFQKAKLEAIKRNINTTVCFTSGGYEIFVDQNVDFVKDGAEEAVAEVAWDGYKSVSIDYGAITFDKSSGLACIAFRPNGMPADHGGGFACGTAPIRNINNKITRVIISQAGRIRID